MDIRLSDKETRDLVEMLTMTSYIMTQTDQLAESKAESMYELIQKIYKQASEEVMTDSFDKEEETGVIYPNAELMSGDEGGPLYVLKAYNEYAAADVLSQQLGLRDTISEVGEPSSDPENFDPKFIDRFIEIQTEYLEEFSENGFENMKLVKSSIIV